MTNTIKLNDFIADARISQRLEGAYEPDSKRINDILAKSLSIKALDLDEVACLLKVNDREILAEMAQAAKAVKQKVYDNRIVIFAPLYLGNFCINDCLYCGFRSSNNSVKRKTLKPAELKSEVRALAGEIGHKRLIAVYGEHPRNNIDYMVSTLRDIYSVRVKARKGVGRIRRVNVNAAPLSIEELSRLKEVGIGTYQVFQETYHRPTYGRIHPRGTVKADYLWRLHSMHRAQKAGVDDVGIGALFGLYDWRYEVMGLAAHNLELEKEFAVGAHTISFPRLEPAHNTPFNENSRYKVSDRDFKKLITVLRLAAPHSGLIITCRESRQLKREALSLGITQTDASSKIAIGSYSNRQKGQQASKQQFILGDNRSLDETVREFTELGYITSFCTAGYRCGRTGKCIMELLRKGEEAKFCKLNAVLTFREWLDDFASPATQEAGEVLIEKELKEIEKKLPAFYPKAAGYYQRIKNGERDLYF